MLNAGLLAYKAVFFLSGYKAEFYMIHKEVTEIALPIKELTEDEIYWQMKNSFHLLRDSYKPAVYNVLYNKSSLLSFTTDLTGEETSA